MNAKLFLKRNASTILTCIGGMGVVGTAILAVKATPKALQVLEEAKEEKGEELTVVEKVVVAGPKYIPAIVVGVATMTCIFGANVLNKRKQAALISAYALIDKSYKEYKGKLKELYGEETHQNIIDSIAIEKAKDTHINASSVLTMCDTSLEDNYSEPVLFYDEFGSRYFEAPVEQVILAEYHVNRNLVLRGYVPLNELYDFLGLEPTEYGDTVGWSVEDEFYWIDFNHRKVLLDDTLECYIIETPWGPTVEALEYYYC